VRFSDIVILESKKGIIDFTFTLNKILYGMRQALFLDIIRVNIAYEKNALSQSLNSIADKGINKAQLKSRLIKLQQTKTLIQLYTI
jgi:hypothetical protein